MIEETLGAIAGTGILGAIIAFQFWERNQGTKELIKVIHELTVLIRARVK